MFRTWFRCTAGCDGAYALDEILYRCPRCEALLEVAHDRAPLRARSGEAWKTLFDERQRSAAHPSGVWAKQEWVAPSVRAEHIVSLGEGGTPLVRATRLGAEMGLSALFIKQCGTSHSGSFKDLGMTVLVSVVRQMVADGRRPIRAVVCASTGDTSASLSAYCAAAGLVACVLLPKGKITTAQLVQPLANGARVLALDTDFDGCMALVQQLAAEPGIYLANSMNSLRIEGQKTVALEICQQLGWTVPDFVFIPGGNLGNVSALGAGFTMMEELGLVVGRPRIVVAQAARANPLYLAYQNGFQKFAPVAAETTLASAIQIGNPVSVRKAIATLERFAGIVEQASEEELADAAAHADRAGLFACPHTGVALAALHKLRAQGVVEPHHRVVVISTASGLKFTDFKVGYHDGSLAGITGRHSNRPIELPAHYEDVKRAVFA